MGELIGARSPVLFLSTWGLRASRNDIYLAVTKAAERVGLHNPESERMKDHFSPHCCRHFFTTPSEEGRDEERIYPRA